MGASGCGFNPTQVRLRLGYDLYIAEIEPVSIPHRYDYDARGPHTPPIVITVSIPHRYDYDGVSSAREQVEVRFQSHTGTITTLFSWQAPDGFTVSIPHRYDYDVDAKVFPRERVMFQSHTGTITTPGGISPHPDATKVSIPHRYDYDSAAAGCSVSGGIAFQSHTGTITTRRADV